MTTAQQMSKATRVLAHNIPKFWELIKFSLAKTERLGVEHSEDVYNNLLAELLSSKSQCFICYKFDKVCFLVITSISDWTLTGKRVMYVRCLYSFKLLPFESWLECFELMKQYAISCGCDSIISETSNPSALQKAFGLGFVSTRTVVTYDLES